MDDRTSDAKPPPLKTDPRYGHYPWWPEDGDDWVHPEDVALARRTIPGPRIWRLEAQTAASNLADGFVTLHYGADRLRVRPRLWRETPKPEFELGDLVEVLPHGMRNDPFTGRIREVLWDDHTLSIHYQLEATDHPVETRYTADDLKPVDPTKPAPMTHVDPPTDESGIDDLLDGPPAPKEPWW